MVELTEGGLTTNFDLNDAGKKNNKIKMLTKMWMVEN